MKQVKFFLVALMAAVMGVSVSSCMNGENDPTVQTGDVVRANMITGGFTDRNGMKLVPSTPSILSGDMYFINFQYDSSTLTANSKTVDITLMSTPTCIDGKEISSSVVEPNVAIYGFSSSYIIPFLFDSNTLVIPFYYWLKNVSGKDLETELAKHDFTLYYDSEKIKEGDTELDLYLSHKINDEDLTGRGVYTGEYKAFNLRYVISEFKEKSKSSLSKINLHAKVNSNSYKLDEANDAKVTLDYK